MNIYPQIGLEEDNREWVEEYDYLTEHRMVDTPAMKRVCRVLQDRLGPDFEHVIATDREVV